jgi:hypothetical protein
MDASIQKATVDLLRARLASCEAETAALAHEIVPSLTTGETTNGSIDLSRRGANQGVRLLRELESLGSTSEYISRNLGSSLR